MNSFRDVWLGPKYWFELTWLTEGFYLLDLNTFHPSVVFHLETSHSICTANQMTGFYMKYNTGFKCVNQKPRSLSVRFTYLLFYIYL